MKYTYNNKEYTIPDKEIDNLIEKLDITKDEAIELWLDDNGITENEEQNKLDEAAKAVKIKHGASAETKEKKKAPQTRTHVNTDEKIHLFNLIKDFLETIAEKENGKVVVLKNEKLLEYTFSSCPDRPLKIDIIQKNKPKG